MDCTTGRTANDRFASTAREPPERSGRGGLSPGPASRGLRNASFSANRCEAGSRGPAIWCGYCSFSDRVGPMTPDLMHFAKPFGSLLPLVVIATGPAGADDDNDDSRTSPDGVLADSSRELHRRSHGHFARGRFGQAGIIRRVPAAKADSSGRKNRGLACQNGHGVGRSREMKPHWRGLGADAGPQRYRKAVARLSEQTEKGAVKRSQAIRERSFGSGHDRAGSRFPRVAS